MPHDRPATIPPADRDVFVWIFRALVELLQRDRSAAELAQGIQRIETAIGVLQTQGTQLMADITLAKDQLVALNTATNTLQTSVDDVIAADQAEDDAFRAEIAELKAQIAAGGAVTQQDLDDLAAGMGGTTATLQAISAALGQMGSNPSQPIPPVDIPPVVPPEP